VRRIAVTGIGIVSPIGTGHEAFWSSALAGRSGVGPVSLFDASGHASRIAGEVRDFDPARWIDPKTRKRLARFSQFAVVAARLAIEDAGFEIEKSDTLRIGVTIGVAAGDYDGISAAVLARHGKGPGHVNPFAIPKVIVNMAASAVAVDRGLHGPNLEITTACASGTHALGAALDMIRAGRCDACVAGGAEACVAPVVMDGYDAMKALSRRNDEPTRASRPFDRDRDGFVIAEGGGILLLEEWEAARRRGARIYAEFAGYGATCDAHHIVAPHPEGVGAAAAIRAALDDAGISPDEVDYINAHGTSTPANDVAETLAIKRALGDHARRVAISSTKSMTGHTFGAAGGIEAAAAVLSIHTGSIHPTINLENPDPDCDLDYVPRESRSAPVRVALSNSFGFGGHNGVLAFRKA
jgi:3-oxoacyl-[acyl-carrier-protein] synthase II